jgi:hypothetical protein
MADTDTLGLKNGYPPYLEMCRRIVRHPGQGVTWWRVVGTVNAEGQ